MKQTHRHSEQTCGCQWEGLREADWEFGTVDADQCRQSGRQQALRAPCTAGGLFTAGATREAPCAAQRAAVSILR